MPKKGYRQTEEHRKNISKGHKELRPSEETRKKLSVSMSKVLRKRWQNSKYRKEKTEAMKKIKRLTGKNHYNWKGGITTYERKLYLNLRRRARKLNTEGSHTFGEWELLKKQYGYKCPCCEKLEPEITLTEDHIIPLSKGGSNYIENIQPLCKSCNSRKNTKIIEYANKL